LRFGSKADKFSLKKKIIVAKSKEMKNWCHLAESSKEGFGSRRVVFPMMVMMLSQHISRFEISNCLHII
jgi:hypothetical protein